MEFTVHNQPFIYQSEFYSIAWGVEHYGFFIDSQGRKYTYDNPTDWNWYEAADMIWGHETDGIIAPEALFANLAASKEQKPLFSFMRKPNPFTLEMLSELTKWPIEDYGQMRCDAGCDSHSVYIYDADYGKYRRILLSCDGDVKMVNQSGVAIRMVKYWS